MIRLYDPDSCLFRLPRVLPRPREAFVLRQYYHTLASSRPSHVQEVGRVQNVYDATGDLRPGDLPEGSLPSEVFGFCTNLLMLLAPMLYFFLGMRHIILNSSG